MRPHNIGKDGKSVRPAPWLTPLGGALLAKHTAAPAFGHSKPATDMINADMTTGGV